MKLGTAEEALEAYDKAIQLYSRFTEIWSNRGIALFALGRCEEAVNSYNAAIQIKPTANLYNSKGLVLGQIGLYNEDIYIL